MLECAFSTTSNDVGASNAYIYNEVRDTVTITWTEIHNSTRAFVGQPSLAWDRPWTCPYLFGRCIAVLVMQCLGLLRPAVEIGRGGEVR